MPKRISEQQRLIAYAMNASEEQLQGAIETLRAIQAHKFPRTPKAQAKRTQKRAAAKQQELLSTSETKPAGKFQPDPKMLADIEEGKKERGATVGD